MLKKKLITALAAAVGILGGNAQAAFVKYDLNVVTFNDGAVANGYFYQDTSNNAIVYYRIEILGTTSAARAFFRPSGIFDAVSESSRSFAGVGPSNFTIFDNLSDFYFQRLSLNFSPSSSLGVFNVSGSQSQQPIPDLPTSANGFSAQRNIVSGTTGLGLADANIVFSLESGVRDFAVIVPAPFQNNVPEPASVALVGFGLVGLIAARRKRK